MEARLNVGSPTAWKRIVKRVSTGVVRRPAAGLLILLAVSLTIALVPAPSVAPSAQPTAPPPAATAGPTGTPTATTTALGISVPGSIDASCASDVSPALNAWIASKPDGSTLVFPAGSCYKLGGDMGVNLKNRHRLTLIGTGSTLQLRTTGVSTFSSAFFMQNSTYITIRGFAVDGGNTATGTTAAAAAVNERMNAAVIYTGSKFIEFDRVSWDRLRGFGVLISSNEGTVWPEDIYIHDSTIRGGEMGIGIIAGRRIRIVGNDINDSVYMAIDLEPDNYSAGPNGEPGHGGGFQDVLISDNDVTRYGWGQNLTSWFVAAVPAENVMATAVMDGLTITGNRVHVGPATADNGNADGLGGLGIRADGANRKRNFVITNNTTTDNDTRSATRSVMNFANIEGLTVTGNRQPVANGAGLVGASATTGTRLISGNDVTP